MNDLTWERAECLPKYVQLELFPRTKEEILTYRVLESDKKVKELADKLDRQRKAQFAKIGAIHKAMDELFERLNVMEKGICKGELQVKDESELP